MMGLMRQKVLSVLVVSGSGSVVITKSSQYVQGNFYFFKYCAYIQQPPNLVLTNHSMTQQ